MKYKTLSILASSLLLCSTSFALTQTSTTPAISTKLQTLVNTPVTADNGYFPLQIVNNLKDSSNINHAYLLMVAQTFSDPANTCVMQFSSKTIGSGLDAHTITVGKCEVPTAGENIGDMAQSIQSLPGYNAATNSVVVYIPHVQSGRAFVSLNHKLSMMSLKQPNGTMTYQAPNDSNVNDPSYDIIYDKFEFTYDQKNTFWINPTSVDFFSLPISLVKYGTSANQDGLIEPYSGAPLYQLNNGSYTGITRTEIMNKISHTLQTAETSDNDWNKLIHNYQNTLIRIAAPHIAPDFPKGTYLDNFVKFITTYYKTHAITIDARELVGDAKNPMPLGEKYGYIQDGPAKGQAKYPVNTYPELYQFTGKVNSDNQFIFSNQLGVDAVNATLSTHLQAITYSINMTDTAAIAKGFFEPGEANTPFATPNKTLQSVLIKNLAAAWSVGLLPAYGSSYTETPDGSDKDGVSCTATQTTSGVGTLLNICYFKMNKANSNFYNPTNPSISSNHNNPWYDVYAAAIHNIMPNTYAYAYDDVAKQDGTLTGSNNTQPVTVVLGDMSGVNIPTPPVPTQFQPASITGVNNSQSQANALYCDGTNCTATVSFTAPAQAGVSYYAMPNNLYSGISASDLAQTQSIVAGTSNGNGTQNYTATITIPQIDVTTAPAQTGNVDGLQVQVFACSNVAGGNCPGQDNYETTPPTGSAIYPQPTVNVLPATITSHSGYTCSGNTCNVTLNWSIPQGQGQGVQYYVGLQGYTLGTQAGFQNDVYSLTSADATTQTITVAKTNLKDTLLQAQVFACSTATNNCPTSDNDYNPENPAPGSTPVDLTKPN